MILMDDICRNNESTLVLKSFQRDYLQEYSTTINCLTCSWTPLTACNQDYRRSIILTISYDFYEDMCNMSKIHGMFEFSSRGESLFNLFKFFTLLLTA